MNGREMAQALGVSEATVSRLASGHRAPSVELMVKVRSVLRWKIDAQADALQAGTYGEVFTAKMERAKAPKQPASTEPGCLHPECVLDHPHPGPAVLREVA